MAKLTAKQQRFADEYLIDLNATQAAIRAGYSPNTAEQKGYKPVQKSSVSDTISRANAERSKQTSINPTGNGDIVEREVKMYDKTKALIELGKHVGLFDTRLKISGIVPIVVLDFGYTNDPTALWCGMVDVQGKKIWGFDELYRKGMSNEAVYAAIEKWDSAKGESALIRRSRRALTACGNWERRTFAPPEKVKTA
jgi:phage terminase small subunit